MALETFKGGRGNKATFTEIDLSTLPRSRETYARIIEAYAAGEVSENQARALSYLLTGFLAYWKLEIDVQFEARLEEIERRLEQ